MASAKEIYKAFTPPLIASLIQRLRKTVNSNGEWYGNFPNWESAIGQCTGYNDLYILETCKDALLKVKNGFAVYERDSVLFDEIQYSWGLLAGLQKAALENAGKLCVLDFGGSLGSSFFQNKMFLNSLKELKWYIVEQPHFVDCGKTYFEDEQLKFYYSIEECINTQQPDVVLLSSVLQYLENPYMLIKKIITLKIPYIILDRTAFIDDDQDVITVQNVPEHIYKASYPAWFFNKANLINQFIKEYTVLASFDTAYTPPAILKGKKIYWEGIIFKK